MNSPTKKSAAGIVRVPFGPCATIDASSASSTVGMSDAASACATEPPIVPMCRTCGSPIVPAVYETIGQSSCSASLASTSWWRVSAPIATWSPSSRTYDRSDSRPMSTSFEGCANRTFISGSSEWPPARIFASASPLSSVIA